MLARVMIAALVVVTGAVSAWADDWEVTRVRGGVFALDNGQWVQLFRGSVVSDDRVIKSAPDGRATLVRSQETIELSPNTTAQIADIDGFTTIYNHAGTVGVDAEARNVKHLAVQTNMLAAVVKGTAFSVRADGAASTVAVFRGTVEVSDSRTPTAPVSLGAGKEVSATPTQTASAEKVVPDSGTVARAPAPAKPAAASAGNVPAKPPINPALLNLTGKALEEAIKAAEKEAKEAEKDAEKAAKDAEKAAKEAAKDAEKAAKDAEKAAEEAAKDAEKAAKEAEEAAEKAAKEAEEDDDDD